MIKCLVVFVLVIGTISESFASRYRSSRSFGSRSYSSRSHSSGARSASYSMRAHHATKHSRGSESSGPGLGTALLVGSLLGSVNSSGRNNDTSMVKNHATSVETENNTISDNERFLYAFLFLMLVVLAIWFVFRKLNSFFNREIARPYPIILYDEKSEELAPVFVVGTRKFPLKPEFSSRNKPMKERVLDLLEYELDQPGCPFHICLSFEGLAEKCNDISKNEINDLRTVFKGEGRSYRIGSYKDGYLVQAVKDECKIKDLEVAKNTSIESYLIKSGAVEQIIELRDRKESLKKELTVKCSKLNSAPTYAIQKRLMEIVTDLESALTSRMIGRYIWLERSIFVSTFNLHGTRVSLSKDEKLVSVLYMECGSKFDDREEVSFSFEVNPLEEKFFTLKKLTALSIENSSLIEILNYRGSINSSRRSKSFEEIQLRGLVKSLEQSLKNKVRKAAL